MDFVAAVGKLISLTNPIHRILGQFENKPQILVSDRALLKSVFLSVCLIKHHHLILHVVLLQDVIVL